MLFVGLGQNSITGIWAIVIQGVDDEMWQWKIPHL